MTIQRRLMILDLLVYVVFHIIYFQIYANRLHLAFAKIISLLLSAFAWNRDIQDNILIAQKILSKFSEKWKSKEYMAIN